MDPFKKVQSRKKFIGLGLLSAASLTLFRFFLPKRAEPAPPPTVRMLTQDGKLVELDAEIYLASKRKKITDTELKGWVGKKKS